MVSEIKTRSSDRGTISILHDDDTITWSAVADCKANNAMPGMERYTTAMAETRASSRVLRRILGLEDFCTKEELAELTSDVEDNGEPAEDSQIMLIEKKFIEDHGVTIETVNKRLKRKEGDKYYINSADELKTKLTSGQAATLIQKLQRYDVKGPGKE